MNEEKVHEVDSSDPIPNPTVNPAEGKPVTEPLSPLKEDPDIAARCKQSLIYGIVSDACHLAGLGADFATRFPLSNAGKIFSLTIGLVILAVGLIFGILGVKLSAPLRKNGLGLAGFITSLIGLVMNSLLLNTAFFELFSEIELILFRS